jgi:hypothetical protein
MPIPSIAARAGKGIEVGKVHHPPLQPLNMNR